VREAVEAVMRIQEQIIHDVVSGGHGMKWIVWRWLVR
jgi:hypothetical protein